jgi:hypothetical protein
MIMDELRVVFALESGRHWRKLVPEIPNSFST